MVWPSAIPVVVAVSVAAWPTLAVAGPSRVIVDCLAPTVTVVAAGEFAGLVVLVPG